MGLVWFIGIRHVEGKNFSILYILKISCMNILEECKGECYMTFECVEIIKCVTIMCWHFCCCLFSFFLHYYHFNMIIV
jgi:hypothetical protein